MKKYDFVFVYENKNRELENICLLSYELKRRGYTVHLIETWHARYHYTKPVEAEVVIAFACYNDDVFDFIASHVYQVKKIINLQWEQVLSVLQETDVENFSAIKGKAKKAMHIAWGDRNKRRLMEVSGVDEVNVSVTGHMALDFFREELKGYYYSREEMEKKYTCIKNKKVYLFISSFGYANIPENHFDLSKDALGDPLLFRRIQIDSQTEILDWISRELPRHKDVLFVYRPHPSEISSPILLEMQQNLDNFVVIQDESVQQWILISDKIYTNFSTSIAQVYAAHKTCVILRPVDIPEADDVTIYLGCQSIKEFSEFSKTFLLLEMDFPIDSELMKEYYCFEKDKPAYKDVADTCERVLQSEHYYIHGLPVNPPLKGVTLLKRRIKDALVAFLVKVFSIGFLHKRLLKHMGKIGERVDGFLYVSSLEKKNYSTATEINELESRIGGILEQNVLENEIVFG